MLLTVGTWDPAWGHTWIARGNGKLYSLRSLAGGSFLCIRDACTLAPIGEYPTSGEHSCHVTLIGKEAVVSDYTSGSLSIYPIDAEGIPSAPPKVVHFDGAGPNPERQSSSHIHSSWASLDGRWIVVADLGSDSLYRFPIKEGCLDYMSEEHFHMPAGSGPRHCCFGKGMLYVSTELSDEILALSWPSMELVQRIVVNSALPGGGGHLVLSPDGRFLYASSRLKNDGIGIFRVKDNGMLSIQGYCRTGAHPRHFCLVPDGSMAIVACRDDNRLEFYNRDFEGGGLALANIEISIEKPVFVQAYEEN